MRGSFGPRIIFNVNNNMKRYAEEDTDGLEDEPKPYRFYEQPITRRVLHFYISKPIGEPEQFVDMIHKMQTATPEDVIYIHLNTPGGNLDTGVQIVNALRATQAHTICSVEGEAHSLGTLIFLSADEFVVHDNVLMMFHNYSGFTVGKGNEQQAYLEATIRWFNDLARALYIPFLTEEEYERIMRGEDLYFHSDEIRTRLDTMVKVIEKNKLEDEQEALKEATEKLRRELEEAERLLKESEQSKSEPPVEPSVEVTTTDQS